MNSEVKHYYTTVPQDSLIRLKELEKIIHVVVGSYETIMSYGVPTVIHDGKKIAHFGGYNKFISLYPLGHKLIAKYSNELQGYHTSKGAIQFPNDKPLPRGVIKKILRDLKAL